jgi:hypothetical protein
MRKKGRWVPHFGISGFKLHEFRCPNLDIHKFLKCKNRKVRPTFRDFGVRGFTVFIAKTSTDTNLEKAKGERWVPHFGISGFELREFRCPTST